MRVFRFLSYNFSVRNTLIYNVVSGILHYSPVHDAYAFEFRRKFEVMGKIQCNCFALIYAQTFCIIFSLLLHLN